MLNQLQSLSPYISSVGKIDAESSQAVAGSPGSVSVVLSVGVGAGAGLVSVLLLSRQVGGGLLESSQICCSIHSMTLLIRL